MRSTDPVEFEDVIFTPKRWLAVNVETSESGEPKFNGCSKESYKIPV
jgi:hypothetical protein